MKKLLFIICLLIGSYTTTAQIVANDDNNFTISGFSGGTTTSVLNNDTLNGTPVNFNDLILSASTIDPSFSLNPDGTISIPPGTQAGFYSIFYQICEVANPTNCAQASVLVSVTPAAIDAVNDTVVVNQMLLGIPLLNVLSNDTLNGTPVNPSLIYYSMISSTNPGVTLSGTNIIVASGTLPGNYTLTYQICENLNPTNCDTAIAYVNVISNAITANNDNYQILSSSPTDPIQIGNVTINDEFNGTPVYPAISNVTPITVGPISIDTEGVILLAPATPLGVYTVTYEICEADMSTGLNVVPPNCDSATLTIIVGNAINAVNDGFQMNITNLSKNVLINDTINSISLNPSDVNLTVLSSSNPNVTIDSSGNIILSQGIPNGIFTLTYKICEIVNPNNCDTATVTINVNLPGLSVTTIATYVDNNADGFTNVGDTITYEFTVKNNHPYNALGTIGLFSSTVNVSGGPLTILNPNEMDSTTFTAVKVLTQQNINNGFYNFDGYFTYVFNGNTNTLNVIKNTILNQSDGIRLIAFIDANSNGNFDSNEAYFTQGSFNYQINSGNIFNLNSNFPIVNLYESDPTNNYNLSFSINPAYTLQYTVTTPNYSNITVANGSGMTTYYFAVTLLPFHDLTVSVTPIFASPRPGFSYLNRLLIKNNGSLTLTNGSVSFIKDPVVTILSISQSGVIATTDGFVYDFVNLLPNASISIDVLMQVPPIPTANLGQLLTNLATVTIPPDDINTTNNTSNLTQVIVGSYDPNDKQESHGGQIEFGDFTADDYLTYTIRFENTGTADAINVRVEDVLDDQLDENSIRMIDASHDYVLERVESNLTWRFDGINLPPSVPDTQIGHGFITFQIKPKPDYAIGDIIPNTAEIYFDFNPAIVTNTCTTEFVETLENPNFAFANLNYFPNPVKNSLTISNNSIIDSVEIISVLGQQMLSQKVTSLQTEINMSGFSRGIYFVKVTSEGQEKTVKIVKE